jgi:hypothetical protein
MGGLNINNFIKEEVQNFINEASVVKDNRFHFNQRLNNSSFSNYDTFTSEFDANIIESDIVITWIVLFWLNDMGIENFVIEVEKAEGTFTIEMRDKHSDEIKQNTPKNINDFNWKFVIDNAVLQKGGSLYISGLEFDFKSQICKVKF